MLKLNKNEYNFEHHPDVVSCVADININNITYYNNDITDEYITQKLAKVLSTSSTKCASNNILLTAGGIGGIELLFNVYLSNTGSKKKTLITTWPTYSAIARHVEKNHATLPYIRFM